jgi:NADH:ubiquinone oxidoreductase subunit 6 (subunit J)
LDTLHSGIFYAFAAATVAGGLLAGLTAGRLRLLALALVAVGLSGLYADLDAGFAALVTLVALVASALLLHSAGPRTAAEPEPSALVRQLGAALAGAVFLVLAYVAFKGNWFAGYHPAGFLNSAALGRLLIGHDALAVEVAAAALLSGVVALTLFTRVRAR